MLTAYGLQVRTRLMQLGKTQHWLIQQARRHTDRYLDSSNLYKLLHGKLHSDALCDAVNRVLELPPQAGKAQGRRRGEQAPAGACSRQRIGGDV